MAEQEQIERLTRSVEEWNQWRRDTGIRPDLTGANLIGANLIRADLSLADFTGANLTNANLAAALLIGANLLNTNLTNANLFGTVLFLTNLIRAHLREADFTHVCFWNTILAEVDLSNVKGLGTANHGGPSVVDINSVILPYDEHIRLHFLRGVGFTETQIQYLSPSYPIPYQSLFISNAHQDETIAQQLYTGLRKKDVPCWIAKHDLRPGSYYRQGIDQAIHTQDKVLLLLSEHSVKSGWVRYEVELALARENDQQREILYPIRLDNAIFECTANWALSLRSTRHIGDFTSWQDEVEYQEAFSTLLQHLKVVKPPTV